MVRAMCGVQPKDIKRSTDLMSMLILNETIDQLVIANSVHWHGHVKMREDGHVLRRKDSHVLRREDGHVWRRALYFEAEGQRKNRRPKRTLKKQVGEESMKVGLRMKDALDCSK